MGIVNEINLFPMTKTAHYKNGKTILAKVKPTNSNKKRECYWVLVKWKDSCWIGKGGECFQSNDLDGFHVLQD